MWTATTSFGRNIHLLLQRIEVVDYDTDEEVEGKEWSADDEDDEVKVVVQTRFILRLLVNLTKMLHKCRDDFKFNQTLYFV